MLVSDNSAVKVSICVPNWNTRQFLRERFETIFAQTFQNWELLVYDSYSEDGSWEYIQDLAGRDSRIRAWQGPREGAYPAWNQCIRSARGSYVYIATSDDTMALDCLEKLVAALDSHPECELAHCPLVVIDQNGRVIPPAVRAHWPEGTAFGLGLDQEVKRHHIRRAPHDGLLHLTQMHAYLSVTQLLIRRSLFTRTGEFQSKWGSVSDFNWEMKAGLLANVIHVPDTWASWRLHPAQLSATIDIRSPSRDRIFDEMIADAVSSCEPLLHPRVRAELRAHWLSHSQAMRAYYSELRRRPAPLRRRLYQLQQLLIGRTCIRREIYIRLVRRPKWGDRLPNEIRQWLTSVGLPPITTTQKNTRTNKMSDLAGPELRRHES
jgi:glycosyltransferase involved in cell wall biosynthesis